MVDGDEQPTQRSEDEARRRHPVESSADKGSGSEASTPALPAGDQAIVMGGYNGADSPARHFVALPSLAAEEAPDCRG